MLSWSWVEAPAAIQAASIRRRSDLAAQLADLVASPSANVVLGEALGELCGNYVLLFSARTSVARLYSIAVGKKWRRRGVARLMLEDAIVRAICRGATRLRLETRADNHRAQALFESLGFESFDQTPDYYEDGGLALRYERSLDIGKI